jgi:hypothetical protein
VRRREGVRKVVLELAVDESNSCIRELNQGGYGGELGERGKEGEGGRRGRRKLGERLRLFLSFIPFRVERRGEFTSLCRTVMNKAISPVRSVLFE